MGSAYIHSPLLDPNGHSFFSPVARLQREKLSVPRCYGRRSPSEIKRRASCSAVKAEMAPAELSRHKSLCPCKKTSSPAPASRTRSRETTSTKANVQRLPDCKPVSVPLRAAVIPLGRTLLSGSSDLPGSLAGRAVPPPLFGLAPRGVFPAGGITPAAVRSYRTISPLPRTPSRARGGIFSVALSVAVAGPPAVSRHAALWRPDFPPPVDRRRLPIRQLTRLLSHSSVSY